MSRYAVPDDITRLGTIPAAAIVDIDTDKQQSALDAASDKADSYIGGAYRLPLSAWGDSLRLAVCQIAVMQLMHGRGVNPEAGHDMSLQMAHDTAVGWLRDISKGHIKPTGFVDTPPTATSVSRVISRTPRGY